MEEKLKHRHELFMRRCFDLAKKGIGLTAPNPIVGAVVTYKNKIIGEGYHKGFGHDHAETMAINSVPDRDKSVLNKSTIYISLEPCFHHGKTPPCVDLLLKYKIPNIVISCVDPNPKVNGKSIQKLQSNNLNVVSNVLTAEGTELIRPFLSRIHNQRPFITMKVAVDRNENMGSAGRSIWLSNKLCKIYTHRLRASVDAILVGTNTVLLDNPQLNNRHFFGRSPTRIFYDQSLKIPTSHHVFSGKYPTLIFTKKNSIVKSKGNPEYICLEEDVNLAISMLKVLHDKGINHLLLEGGAGVFKNFINDNLWDECILIRTDKLIQNAPIPFLGIIGTKVETIELGDNIVEKWLNTSLDS